MPGRLDRDPFEAVLDAVQDYHPVEEYCGGCELAIDDASVERGVIQFASKLWHPECFRCAECSRQLSTNQGNTLLLSNGLPICGACNYSCDICGLPITEEALMTGNQSYHAACFTCRSCNNRIVDLVFAKTSHGIYCMACHNQRVARSRRHAEQRRARKQAQALETKPLPEPIQASSPGSSSQPLPKSRESSPKKASPPLPPSKSIVFQDPAEETHSTTQSVSVAKFSITSRSPVKRTLAPSTSASSRLTKGYSFYDPDFLNLMDSFRDSSNDLRSMGSVPTSPLPSSPLPPSPGPTSPPASKGELGSRSPLPAASLPTTPLPVDSMPSTPVPTASASTSPLPSSSAAATSTFPDEEQLAKMRAVNGTPVERMAESDARQDLKDTRQRMSELQFKYDRMRRASAEAAQGFSLARDEFHQEVEARHQAETEAMALRRRLAELELAGEDEVEPEREAVRKRYRDEIDQLAAERDRLTLERDQLKTERDQLATDRDRLAKEVRELKQQATRQLPELPNSAGLEVGSLDSVAIVEPVAKMFKWKRGPAVPAKSRAGEHDFQGYHVLRPARCVGCQKNMWGQSEMRCTLCAQVCHTRCLGTLPMWCEAELDSGLQSMFGRDLIEQARSEGRDVPLIVTKCIEAVEACGMDYEGIYRKSGGTLSMRVIAQLFDQGAQFDLCDMNRFNDISAVTSVLKQYLRELPIPLLTLELHDDFLNAGKKMAEVIALLPRQHYFTLKALAMHLYRVQQSSAQNRMNARNLGVVFGPTLMRSQDPSQEFVHMGGKALAIEHCIEHAPELFA